MQSNQEIDAAVCDSQDFLSLGYLLEPLRCCTSFCLASWFRQGMHGAFADVKPGMRWMDAASCLAAERRLQADSSGSRSSTKPHAWAGWGMVLVKCKALHV